MKEEQLFIGTEPSLFGMLYTPEKRNGKAMLVIHPFAEERKSSIRVLVSMAKELCGKGYFVLMFDLRGCGDSSLTMREATVDGWVEDISSAADYLRQRSGVPNLTLLGLRFGAYLASLYASRNSMVNHLVLLEPVVKPVEYLRKSLRSKLMKELITDGNVSSDRNRLMADLQHDKTIDFDGYPITGTFYKSLEKAEAEHAFCDITDRHLPVSIVTMSKATANTIGRLSLPEMFCNCKIGHLETPPFWTKLDYDEPTLLILLILELLKDD